MDVFSEDQLEKLKNHKYRSQGKSILEPYFELLWDFSVAQLPTWLSPNVVTLAGILSILMPSLLLIYNAYQSHNENVALLSYFCSIGFFLWMNLDSIDGKLARRNRPNKQSPFGEILDHGGDAITVLIAFTALGCQMGLQDVPYFMLIWVLNSVCTNYIAEPWTIYLTGIMKFESVDFVEIMLLLSTICLTTGLWGVAVWRTVVIQSLNLQIRHLVFGLHVILALNMVLGKCKEFHTLKGSKGFEIADVFGPGIPLITVLLSALITYQNSTQEFLNGNIIFIAICFGIPVVKVHVKFIVAHMVKEKFKPLDYCLLFPVALSIGMFIFNSAVSEKIWLFSIILFAAMDAGIYFFRIFYQLYHAFDEQMFVISRRSHDMKCQNGVNGFDKPQSS